jgi:hypothetical protein
MRFIEHIIEPHRLLLSWQPATGHRARHIVAELRENDGDADLSYFVGQKDYEEALRKGFEGSYPGFPAPGDHHNVLSAFMRRLPPRQRKDFDTFLESIRIRPKTAISDFALLGYSGAKLPSDDFVIIHPFDEARPPFEFLLLLAGYRHYEAQVPYSALKVGEVANFVPEPDNRWDADAVRVFFPGLSAATAGYVCRGLLPQFHRWLSEGLIIQAQIERLNGTQENPLVYLFISVTGR